MKTNNSPNRHFANLEADLDDNQEHDELLSMEFGNQVGESHRKKITNDHEPPEAGLDVVSEKNYYQKAYFKRYRPNLENLEDLSSAEMAASIQAVEGMLQGLAHLQETYRLQVEDLASATGSLLAAYHRSSQSNSQLRAENTKLQSELTKLKTIQSAAQEKRKKRDSSSDSSSEDAAIGKRKPEDFSKQFLAVPGLNRQTGWTGVAGGVAKGTVQFRDNSRETNRDPQAAG